MSGDIFACHDSEESTLLASGEKRPGMLLLNILQPTKQPLSQRIPQPNMSIVLRQSRAEQGQRLQQPELCSLEEG